jgi:hypothetical protein
MVLSGDGYVASRWAPPFLAGTVFVEANPSTDFLDIDTSALAIYQAPSLRDFGVVFAPPIAFTKTGHGITVADGGAGASDDAGGYWLNLAVWGGDGNHDAYRFPTGGPINAYGLTSYGGGCFNWTNTATTSGNSTWVNLSCGLNAGGSEHGIKLAGGNLMQFVRPSSGAGYIATSNVPAFAAMFPAVPPPNPLQQVFYAPNFHANLEIDSPDFEVFSTQYVQAFTYPSIASLAVINPTYSYSGLSGFVVGLPGITAGGIANLGGLGSSSGAANIGPILYSANVRPVNVNGFLALANGFTVAASGGGCGTIASKQGGQDGRFTAGAVTSCTVTITAFGTATAVNPLHCWASDETTPADTFSQTSSSTTACTLTGTIVSGDVIWYHVSAF